MNVDNRYTDEMVAFRRSIHEHPETGWTEFRTTSIIVKRLKELGFEVLEGLQAVNPDFVMGRYPEEVKAAKKRALEEGVSEADLDAMQGYTGAIGICALGGPDRCRRCGLISMRSSFRKRRIPTTFQTNADSPQSILGRCMPADMIVTRV